MLRLILSDLALWARGLPCLFSGRSLGRSEGLAMAVQYKPGWGPWSFLPLYCTTYLAGTLLGYGVVSLSRAWWERSQEPTGKYVFARLMTRLLDRLVPGDHGAHTGPWLWGSASRRNLVS
jgi:hypothetical protein